MPAFAFSANERYRAAIRRFLSSLRTKKSSACVIECAFRPQSGWGTFNGSLKIAHTWQLMSSPFCAKRASRACPNLHESAPAVVLLSFRRRAPYRMPVVLRFVLYLALGANTPYWMSRVASETPGTSLFPRRICSNLINKGLQKENRSTSLTRRYPPTPAIPAECSSHAPRG